MESENLTPQAPDAGPTNAELMKKKVAAFLARWKLAILSLLVLLGADAATVAKVSAAIAINWTDLGEMFDGIASLMPHVSDLIIAIVPTIVIIVVVGFIIGLLAMILMGIGSAFKGLDFSKWIK